MHPLQTLQQVQALSGLYLELSVPSSAPALQVVSMTSAAYPAVEYRVAVVLSDAQM
jgi:hypothetical protein